MRQSHQTGQLAEWLCILRLWLTGWRILDTRWRCPNGEVDIIAKRGNLICFIEVKARRTHEAALGSLSATQRQRISNAASLWMAQNSNSVGTDMRFDVMSVSTWPWPKRIRNAF